MTRVRIVRRATLAAGAALAVAACNSKSDTTATQDPPATISATPTSLALHVGDTASVTASTTPALSAGHATVAWASSQPSVVSIQTVAPLGARATVKALAPGTAQLTLTFTAGAQTATTSVFAIVISSPQGSKP